MHRDDITEAAIKVLARRGITGWTTAAVAHEAGCAKGLVHYHHKTKSKLLAAMAGRLAHNRLHNRLRPLGRRGTTALDGLWEVVRSSVRTGSTQAWLGLSSLPDAKVRAAFLLSAEALLDTARAIEGALETPALHPAIARTVHATLDGLEIALLRGDDPSAVQEVYHRFWLGLL